jgi:hypothetical protein
VIEAAHPAPSSGARGSRRRARFNNAPVGAREDSIVRYLAAHDHACACGYNLRGLQMSCCPECGRDIDIPPDEAEVERVRTSELVEYLRSRDVRCKHCGYNLRGLTTNRCPECNASYMLAGGAVSYTSTGASRGTRRAPFVQRTRSRLILLALGGSTLAFLSLIAMLGLGSVEISTQHGLALLLAVVPWVVLLAWSLTIDRIQRLAPRWRWLLGAAAELAAGGSIALLVWSLFR